MELLAHDVFRLITYQELDQNERDVLTLLYQPIIGSDAFTLYLTLWAMIHKDKKKTTEYKHGVLYDCLRMSPRQFAQTREKLEAVGLLDTYHNDEVYLYEIKTPLTAEEFIKDGSLGAILFSKVGSTHFELLSNMFRVSATEKDGFTNISSTFDKVFESLPKPIQTSNRYEQKSKSKITINHSFDFDVFLEGLSKNFVDRRKITKSVKEKIHNLSYVYNLDEFTMQKVFMDSVDKDRNVDLDKLSQSARKWFEFEKDTTVHVPQREHNKDIKSYDEVLEQCKTATPSDILAILSSGKPSTAELKVIERLREHYDLPDEVINFMIVYVIGQLEEFPSYNYFDKVAVEWQRNNVQTIEEAIATIKRRNQRRQKTSQKREKNTIPDDIESDWFDEYWKSR